MPEQPARLAGHVIIGAVPGNTPFWSQGISAGAGNLRMHDGPLAAGTRLHTCRLGPCRDVQAPARIGLLHLRSRWILMDSHRTAHSNGLRTTDYASARRLTHMVAFFCSVGVQLLPVTFQDFLRYEDAQFFA